MKLLILLLTFVLFGCATDSGVVKVLPQISCGKDLAPDSYQACVAPTKLLDGTTFNDVLNDDASLRKTLTDCQVKVKVLQNTLLACQKVQ